MDNFITSLEDYISSLKSRTLDYATNHSQVLVAIEENDEEILYNKLLSYLPLSLSILEEIEISNNNNVSNYNKVIYVKGTIINQSNDNIDNKVELDIDQYTIDTTLLALYPIPLHLTTVPIVGRHYLISNKRNNNGILIDCLLERIEYVDQIEERNINTKDIKYLVFTTQHYGQKLNDKIHRFMIPIYDVYLYEHTFQNISSSFIPSMLIAWSYYTINNKTNMTEFDNSYLLKLINEVQEGLSKIVKHIEVLVASIVQINHVNHNYNPENDNSSISTIMDDTFVRKYINVIRLIQDYYQIISITIQMFVPVDETYILSNDITSSINMLIDTNIDTINEYLSKILYLCPTMYLITTSQWVDILCCAFDMRSTLFFVISQIQSYNKSVKIIKKNTGVSNKLLADKKLKSFAEELVEILDDIQETNLVALTHVIHTHFMADILNQDWGSNKEFRRGQCISYGVSASVTIIIRLLNEIRIKAYKYHFFYVSSCISSLKLLVDIVKEEYMNISCLSRTKSKQFVQDLKYLMVSTIDIIQHLQNESVYNDCTEFNGDNYLWFGKKQGIFNVDFITTNNNMRNKVFLKANGKLFSLDDKLLNSIEHKTNTNVTFSEQLNDQSLSDLVLSILELQLIVLLLDKDDDDDDMVDTLERNIDKISEDHHGSFSIKWSERVGLDTILSLVSNLQPSETLIQSYYFDIDIDIDRISKSVINRSIVNLINIDPLYLHSILSKHYVCIGDDDDNTIFPNLTESEKLKRMNIKSLNEKLRNDNYVSLD